MPPPKPQFSLFLLLAVFGASFGPLPKALAATPPVVIFGTGLASDGHTIYKITIPSSGIGTSTPVVALPSDPSADNSSPNGIALDNPNNRLYFSVDPGSANDQLYSVDLSTPPGPAILRGTVVGRASGAFFYDGSYYYLDSTYPGTNNVYKVTLSNLGSVAATELQCAVTNVSDPSMRLILGDLVGLQGMLYGSGTDTRNTYNTGDDRVVFFKVNLETCALSVTERPELSRQLQLAWGIDFKLYGYSPSDKLLYVLDKDTGAASPGPDYVPTVSLSDIDALAPEASVAIVKKTNDTDNNDPGTGPEVTIGDPVAWTYTVTNTGQLTLEDVTVTDDRVEAEKIDCDGGTNTELDNVVASLAPGSSVTCTANGTATQEGEYVNVGTVAANYEGPLGKGALSKSDPDRYIGVTPEEPPLACPAGGFFTEMLPNGDLAIRYDQFPAPNDNSYGTNAVGWPKGHKFRDYTGSDKAGIQIADASGTVRLSFNLDYLSGPIGTKPSGYASMGPFGGDGKVLVGTLTPSDIEWDTSLARNLNNYGYFIGGVQVKGLSVADLLVNSPPTVDEISDYTLTPAAQNAFPDWDFHNTYFAVIKASKLAAMGFNYETWKVEPNLTALHNSPAKPCPSGASGGELTIAKSKVSKKKVEVTFQNSSSSAVTLTELRVNWPQAINGNLKKIKLGKAVLWESKSGVSGGSTDTSLGNPVGVPPLLADVAARTIPSGKSAVWTLEFKDNAASLTDPGYAGTEARFLDSQNQPTAIPVMEPL